MFKKSLAAIIAVLTVFVFVGQVNASRDGVDRVNRAEVRIRVIAHTQEEVAEAVSQGCTVVTTAKILSALQCPEEVAKSLSLSEDVRVFALEDESHMLGRGIGIQSDTANKQIGADKVQVAGNTGSGRKIMVLDTGYNYNHPELSSSYLGGKDFVNGDDDPLDDQGHGSHVAGIITADGIDSKAKGVAPDAGIIVGKVLDQYGAGYFSDVVAGIYWAVDGPDGLFGTEDDFNADAINLSLGTGAPYLYRGFCDGLLPDLTDAIKYAVQNDVMVAVAAGNSGSAGVSLPGCISYSTTVGAVDSRDRVASFSGRGKAVDISAPGVSMYSTVLGTGYASWSGTSMATPVIAGVAALVKSVQPTYTQGQLENKLFSTALDLGKRGKDTNFGWGRVDAFKAAQ